MNCQNIQKLIPVYLDGELNEAEQKSVQEHLAACPQCQVELECQKGVWDLLDDQQTIEPAADYVSRFWTRLSVENNRPNRFVERWARFFKKPTKWVPVLSTSALLVLVTFVAVYHMTHERVGSIAVKQNQEFEWEADDFIEYSKNAELIENLEFFDNLDVVEKLGA